MATILVLAAAMAKQSADGEKVVSILLFLYMANYSWRKIGE